MLNVRLLRCFVAVADELSFTAAAHHLNMAQPALTRSIKQLEQELDARLLDRNTRNVRLTEIGHAFLGEARKVLDQIVRAERVGREMARGQIGQIRIGYVTYIAQEFLAPLLKRFNQHRPNIRIELLNMGTEQQRTALVERTVDLGFMLGPFSTPGIQTCRIRDEQLVVIMPDDHRLAQQEMVTALDLHGEQLVIGSEAMWNVYRQIIFSEFDRFGVSPNISQEAPTVSAMFALVSAGMGLAILPRGPTHYLTSRMVLRPFMMQQNTICTVCAWNRDNSNAAVQALLDCLSSAIAEGGEQNLSNSLKPAVPPNALADMVALRAG
ncbi:MAG: LysR family transcriptional regulator [Rhizobiaceae bacterium]